MFLLNTKWFFTTISTTVAVVDLFAANKEKMFVMGTPANWKFPDGSSITVGPDGKFELPPNFMRGGGNLQGRIVRISDVEEHLRRERPVGPEHPRGKVIGLRVQGDRNWGKYNKLQGHISCSNQGFKAKEECRELHTFDENHGFPPSNPILFRFGHLKICPSMRSCVDKWLVRLTESEDRWIGREKLFDQEEVLTEVKFDDLVFEDNNLQDVRVWNYLDMCFSHRGTLVGIKLQGNAMPNWHCQWLVQMEGDNHKDPFSRGDELFDWKRLSGVTPVKSEFWTPPPSYLADNTVFGGKPVKAINHRFLHILKSDSDRPEEKDARFKGPLQVNYDSNWRFPPLQVNYGTNVTGSTDRAPDACVGAHVRIKGLKGAEFGAELDGSIGTVTGSQHDRDPLGSGPSWIVKLSDGPEKGSEWALKEGNLEEVKLDKTSGKYLETCAGSFPSPPWSPPPPSLKPRLTGPDYYTKTPVEENDHIGIRRFSFFPLRLKEFPSSFYEVRPTQPIYENRPKLLRSTSDPTNLSWSSEK